MEKIKEALLLHPKQPDNIMMWAACCTAFLGFLRCSEFTVPAEDSFDPEAHLSLADVAVDDKMSPTVVQVTIKQSKTDPFRQGAHLYLGMTDTVICPVKAMLAYLAVRDPAPGPLFKLTYKNCLTRQAFSTLLSRTLTTAGVSNKGFITHRCSYFGQGSWHIRRSHKDAWLLEERSLPVICTYTKGALGEAVKAISFWWWIQRVVKLWSH